MSSPQSSVPGSVILGFLLGLRPASLSFVKRSFCRNLALVGSVVVDDERFDIGMGGVVPSWMACIMEGCIARKSKTLQIYLMNFKLIFLLHSLGFGACRTNPECDPGWAPCIGIATFCKEVLLWLPIAYMIHSVLAGCCQTCRQNGIA